MNRNSEFRFGINPTIKLKRSVFKMIKNVKGSFNLGYIIPFYLRQDVLPGETWKISQSIVVRLATPIYPTMDNLVLDTYFFYGGKYLYWTNFKKFMGENENGSWAQTTELIEPYGKTSGNGIPAKSIWDYMGVPTGITGLKINLWGKRIYVDVYNKFFRNQNLIAPVANSTSDSSSTLSSAQQNFVPLKASRLPDYLSTCLPGTQKGNPVKIPLGEKAYVKQDLTPGGSGSGLELQFVGDQTLDGKVLGLKTNQYAAENGFHLVSGTNGIGNDYNVAQLFPLYADLSEATAATINALRLAFQTQKILEADARGGTRYFDEILMTHFGTTSGAAQYEKPMYLGGARIPIVMNQISQTSQSSETSPMGNVAAFSLTVDNRHVFTKSFTTHGIILGVMVARYLTHTYQQGLDRQFNPKKRLEYYFPALAHLGEQPIYNKEIYAQGTSQDDEVFGYQERWAEYKYERNVICGELRSNYSTPLDSWHYGDNYENLPGLNQTWIEEDDTALKRTLAVQDQDQFIFDTDINITRISPIATWCYPGLIDHF